MSAGQTESELTPLEWIAAIVCAPLGLIMGLFYLVNGKAKAGKMLLTSILFSLLLAIAMIVLIGTGLIRL